jgi:hypothetical protein
MKTDVDYSELLANWSVDAEQRRADFIDFLYWLYDRKDGLYTGLWQQFTRDLAEITRNNLNEDQSFIEAVVNKFNVMLEEGRIVASVTTPNG